MVAFRHWPPRESHEYSRSADPGGVHTAASEQFAGSAALPTVQCTSDVQPCGGEWSVVCFHAHVQPR